MKRLGHTDNIKSFSFDDFKVKEVITITHRYLYKCPACGEYGMEESGGFCYSTHYTCNSCGADMVSGD